MLWFFWHRLHRQVSMYWLRLCLNCDMCHSWSYVLNHYPCSVSYNFTSLHSSLLYQAVADEAILRDSLEDPSYEINFSIWPLPITKVEEGYTLAQNSFSAWFLLVLSFPFIAGSFATFIVSERESKAKHLQTVAGVKPSAYWLSTYLWDIINYQLPMWITVILMYSLDVGKFFLLSQSIVMEH